MVGSLASHYTALPGTSKIPCIVFGVRTGGRKDVGKNKRKIKEGRKDKTKKRSGEKERS